MTERGATVLDVIRPPEARAVLERLRAAGGTVQTTFALPAEPWDLASAGIACIAAVEGHGDAVAALTVALRHAGLVAIVDPDRPWDGLDDFLEDVLRLRGTVVRATAAGSPAGAGAAGGSARLADLSDDQRQILALLAAGESLPEVAAQLYLSLRTAERRLGAARRLLGVRTTAEALVLVVGRPG